MKMSRRQRGIAFSLLLSLAILPLASASGDMTIFGPKRFDRHRGAPTVYHDTFNRCGTVGTAILRVTNGDGPDTRVTSAEIEINGREVTRESDFKKKVPSFEKTVSLRESNTLTVKLKSGRHDGDAGDHHDDPGDRDDDHDGGRLRDEHKGSGADKDSLRRKSSQKSGGKDETRHARTEKESDGRDDDHERGDHPASFLIIEVVAVGCDTVPPVISIQEPSNGSLLNVATPQIAANYADETGGMGIDPATVRLTVDGTDVTSSSSVSLTGISYTPSSNLPDGAHRVTVSVADRAGNQAGLAWTFTTDTVAPAAIVTSHQSNQYVNTAVVTLAGSLDDQTAIVTVNGQNAQVNGNGFSLANFALAEGDNAVTVMATDPAGNYNSSSINIIRDTVLPVIQTTNPQPNDFVNTQSITVTGTIAELHLAGIWINDSPVQAANGSFSQMVALQMEGGNSIVLRAKDLANNETIVTIPVTLDTTPPVVQISAPAKDSFVNIPQASVTGTVNEEVTSVTVNSVPATITGNSFSLANVTLVEGPNTVLVEAKDRAGNSGTQSITVTLDTIKPAIQVTAPVKDSFVNTGSITVSGSVVDVNPAGLWVNATEVQLNGQNFTLAGIALAEGPNTITVRATDKAGNESVLPVPLTLDTVVPVVTITAPVPNALLNLQQVTVSGTVSEMNTMVTVNGSVAQVTGQNFTLAGVALAEGLNSINVVAADRAGNPGPASVTVTVDTTAPAAPVLGQPASPTRTAQTSISGTAEAGSTVQVSATGPDGLSSVIGTLTADAQGGFTILGITLLEGTTSFTAQASDAAGNRSIVSAPVAVTLDTEPPVITLTGPANNSFAGTPTVQVTGSLNDASATLTINGTAVPLNSGSFSHEATLTSGLNSLVLVATDPAGNSASSTVLVTLDQTPPAVTITSPLNNILVKTPQVIVSGFVDEPVISVTANSLTALISAQSFSIASFTLSEGVNAITVEAKDRAGNAGSSVVNITLDSIAPGVSLAAPAQAVAGTTVLLSFSAGDTGGLRLAELIADNSSLWSFSPNSEPTTQNSISYTLPPDLAPGTVVNLQARAYDVAGNMGTASAQVVITQGPSGPGYIQGEVYDDTRGLLLEGADVLVTAIGREAKHMTTGADGGYYTETAKGDYLITITKPGFTPIERLVTVRPEKTSLALDARLTPISGQQNLVSSSGGAITMPLPVSSAATGTAGAGIVSQATGTIELIVPSGAVAAQKDIRLTLVSNQGLANPLPRGWSPIAAANVSVQPLVSGEGSELLFRRPAELRLPVEPGLSLATVSPAAIISYDITVHQWIVRSRGAVSEDGATVSASIASTGQYALVLPDDPAQTMLEQDAPLLPLPVIAAPEPQQISAAGGVVPPFSLPAVDLRATGELIVARSEGATIDLASGLVLNARVSERFDLLPGDVVLPTDHVQDLLLYRYPCATNIGAGVVTQSTGSAGSASAVDLETQTAGRVGTTFPVAPSKEYSIVQLMMGKVGFTITLPEPDASGSLIGSNGGRLLDTDGTVISVPAGALTETIPVKTRTVAPAVASGLVGTDFSLLRAVEVNFTGRILSSSAELSIPAPAGFNAGLPVVVAKAIDVRGVQKLKLVALADISGSLITSLAPGPMPPVAGIISSGMFFFLQAKAPLGYVKGTVVDSAGNLAPFAFLTSSTCSLADLTGPNGNYLIASTVATFGVRAMDIYSYNEGLGSGTIAAAGQTATIDLSIAVTPPHVVSILPADGAVKIEPNTPIEISFSEPLDKLTITSANITVKNSAGSAVSGAFSVNAESTIVTFYPAALLASETAYTVSILGNTLKDLQGNAMSGGFSSMFTIRDTTPPLLPPAGRITATFPDAGGMVTVSATQGTVEAEITVLIINDTTGEIVTVLSGTDGSFSGRIAAQLGDEAKIVMMDAAGNQTLISYISFKSDDGKYLVTAKGGIVEGEAGSRLVIPEGALPGPTVIKLTAVTEEQLPHPVLQPGQFLAALNIDTGGVKFKKEVKLSVPVPAGITAETPVFLTQPTVLQNADGTVENVYSVIDSTKIIDGRLTTASEPFDGVWNFGIFSFTAFPTIYPAIVSGYAYRDMDNDLAYHPVINADGSYDPAHDQPVRNAVVRTPGGDNYITQTKSDGFYATFTSVTNDIGTINPGNCRDYKVTAIHPQTMHRVTLTGSVCEPPFNIQRLNFALANADSVPPDTASPVISLNLKVAPGQTTVPGENVPPQFVAGTIPVNTDIEVPIEVRDQEISTAALKVTYKTPDMAAGLEYTVSLTQTGSVVYTTISPDNPAPVYKYTYSPNFNSTTPSSGFGLPVNGSAQALFRPSAAGTYTLTVEATDTAGHSSTRSMTVRAVLSGTQPAGLDGPPRVDEIIPADGAKEIMVTMPVIVTFSEVVDPVTVNSDTFQLLDMGPAGSQTMGTGAPVPAGIYTSIEGGRMRATLQPRTNMLYGNVYKVVLTNGITDYASSNIDGTTKGLENPMTVTFTTKVPQAYDLSSGDQFQPAGASDIALYTAADGRTFAYIASGVSGFRVADVTDPTHPFITYDSTQVEQFSSLTKAYRGVAVDQQTGILAVTDLITYTMDSSTQSTQSTFNAIGTVRFFDLNGHPDNPGYQIGHERLAENYSGVPGRLAVSGNYAYVSTAMVGLQVVDIEASKSFNSSNVGASIIGVYDSINTNPSYRQPMDIKLYKGGRAVLTTSSGNLLVLDVNMPEYPQLIRAYKPDGYSAYRADVAAEYAWTDEGGNTQLMDVAVTGSADGKVHTVDLTDPYNPQHYGPVKNTDGSDLLCFASDITISRTSGLVYIAGAGAVYVIDIKDPTDPKLLNIIAQTPLVPGSATMDPLGYATALVEKDGWVYLANMQKGMRVLDLDPKELGIETESEFGNVKIPETDYYPALETKGITIYGQISGVPLDQGWGLFLTEPLANANVLIGGTIDAQGLPAQLTTNANYINRFTANEYYKKGFTKMYLRWIGPLTALPADGFIAIRLQARKTGTSNLNSATITKPYTFTFRIRHNGNITLGEVLKGMAVFVSGGPAGTSTPGTVNDKLKKFDYVQEQINQVLPRIRQTYNQNNNSWEANSYSTLVNESGQYDLATSKAIRLFRKTFQMDKESSWKIGNTEANFTIDQNGTVRYVENEPIAANNDNTTDTFRKLMKDYNHRGSWLDSQNWVDKIVDQETLVGKRQRTPGWLADYVLDADNQINAAEGNTRNDTGLYELYKNIVVKFVDKMIKEAERYAGISHNIFEEVPTDKWISRQTTITAGSIVPGYGPGGCSATTNPPCSGPHGPGMSYCYGCNSDIHTFNSMVSKWPAPPRNQVPINYRGNIDEANNQAGQPDDNTADGDPVGTKYWTGLYQTPEWNNWNDYFTNTANACDATSGVSQREHHLYPQKWAGIDCSAFVQRVVNAADPVVNLTIAGELPNVKTTIFNLGEYAESCASRELDKRAWVAYYFNDTLEAAKNRTYFKAFDTEQEREEMTPKLRKGDIVRYTGPNLSHVSIVYSEKPACTAITNNAGEEVTNCTYQVIHANGTDFLDLNGNNLKEHNEYSRKVRINPNSVMPTSTGFGRIKLWD
ncbi:MAG: Ig-like domain-containing protein [Nitrospirota bacterium]